MQGHTSANKGDVDPTTEAMTDWAEMVAAAADAENNNTVSGGSQDDKLVKSAQSVTGMEVAMERIRHAYWIAELKRLEAILRNIDQEMRMLEYAAQAFSAMRMYEQAAQDMFDRHMEYAVQAFSAMRMYEHTAQAMFDRRMHDLDVTARAFRSGVTSPRQTAQSLPVTAPSGAGLCITEGRGILNPTKSAEKWLTQIQGLPSWIPTLLYSRLALPKLNNQLRK
jgi:hypothetical protein